MVLPSGLLVVCMCVCVHPIVSISLENADQKGETSQNYSEKYRKTNYEEKIRILGDESMGFDMQQDRTHE